MTRSKRNTYIILVVVVAVNLLLVGLISSLILSRIIADSRQLVFEEQAFAQDEVTAETIRGFQKFRDQKKQEIERFESLFIDSTTPIGFLKFMENLAQDFQLELKVAPGNPEKIQGDPWRSLTFTILTDGSYSSITRFIEKLELSPYVLETISLRIIQATQKADGNVQATVMFKVYTNEN